MQWINEDARKLYDLYNEERIRIAKTYGLLPDTENSETPLTATALRRREKIWRDPRMFQARWSDYRDAVRPIEKAMINLASYATKPGPIIITAPKQE